METNNKQEIGSRINELMFRLEKNQSSFAKAIGTSQTAIYNTVHGKTKPRYEFIEAVLVAFPKVSRDWLMEGKGEMFLSKETKEIKEESLIVPSDYLMQAIARIEASFKSTSEEKDRVIADQRFIIDTLKNQVAALTSVNGSFIEVSEVPPVPFIKKKMQVIFKVENPVFLSNG
jgi:transcriptional regulator with XRE-family HTH domain